MEQTTKRSVIIFTVMCALLICTASFANDGRNQLPSYQKFVVAGESSLKVDLKWIPDSETLGLVIENPEGKRVSVTVRDESGTVLTNFLFNKNQKKLVRYYSFSQAEEGNYSMDISDGATTVKKKINLKRVQSKETTILSIL